MSVRIDRYRTCRRCLNSWSAWLLVSWWTTTRRPPVFFQHYSLGSGRVIQLKLPFYACCLISCWPLIVETWLPWSFWIWRRPMIQYGPRYPATTPAPMYTADLMSVIESHDLSPRMYADDTQMYGSCRPAAVDALSSKISEYVGAVSSWTVSCRLGCPDLALI